MSNQDYNNYNNVSSDNNIDTLLQIKDHNNPNDNNNTYSQYDNLTHDYNSNTNHQQHNTTQQQNRNQHTGHNEPDYNMHQTNSNDSSNGLDNNTVELPIPPFDPSYPLYNYNNVNYTLQPPSNNNQQYNSYNQQNNYAQPSSSQQQPQQQQFSQTVPALPTLPALPQNDNIMYSNDYQQSNQQQQQEQVTQQQPVDHQLHQLQQQQQQPQLHINNQYNTPPHQLAPDGTIQSQHVKMESNQLQSSQQQPRQLGKRRYNGPKTRRPPVHFAPDQKAILRDLRDHHGVTHKKQYRDQHYALASQFNVPNGSIRAWFKKHNRPEMDIVKSNKIHFTQAQKEKMYAALADKLSHRSYVCIITFTMLHNLVIYNILTNFVIILLYLTYFGILQDKEKRAALAAELQIPEQSLYRWLEKHSNRRIKLERELAAAKAQDAEHTNDPNYTPLAPTIQVKLEQQYDPEGKLPNMVSPSLPELNRDSIKQNILHTQRTGDNSVNNINITPSGDANANANARGNSNNDLLNNTPILYDSSGNVYPQNDLRPKPKPRVKRPKDAPLTRKPTTKFSIEQKQRLEQARDKEGITARALHIEHRRKLANELGLEPIIVNRWFDKHRLRRDERTQTIFVRASKYKTTIVDKSQLCDAALQHI